MKNRFEKPMMEKINFEAEDIIVTSGGCSSDAKCPTNCMHVCSGDCLTVCSYQCYHVGDAN